MASATGSMGIAWGHRGRGRPTFAWMDRVAKTSSFNVSRNMGEERQAGKASRGGGGGMMTQQNQLTSLYVNRPARVSFLNASANRGEGVGVGGGGVAGSKSGRGKGRVSGV